MPGRFPPEGPPGSRGGGETSWGFPPFGARKGCGTGPWWDCPGGPKQEVHGGGKLTGGSQEARKSQMAPALVSGIPEGPGPYEGGPPAWGTKLRPSFNCGPPIIPLGACRKNRGGAHEGGESTGEKPSGGPLNGGDCTFPQTPLCPHPGVEPPNQRGLRERRIIPFGTHGFHERNNTPRHLVENRGPSTPTAEKRSPRTRLGEQGFVHKRGTRR